MTDFLSAERMRESAFGECAAYLTTMISYVVATSKTQGEQFQLDVDALFNLFFQQPQNERMALPKYARDLFNLVVCFNFSEYYDIAHAATIGAPVYPESHVVGIKANDLTKISKKILGTKRALSFVHTINRNINLFESYGIFNKIVEDASEFKVGAAGHIKYVQITPEFIKYFYEYVRNFDKNDLRTETEQGKD